MFSFGTESCFSSKVWKGGGGDVVVLSNVVAASHRFQIAFFQIKVYVLFISDFERTKHFHFLNVTFEKDQKRTKVAKFSK